MITEKDITGFDVFAPRTILARNIKKEKTESGILLTEEAATSIGFAICVNKNRDDVHNIKVGDGIVYRQYSPDEITIGDETFLFIHEDDILAKFKEKKI